MAGSRSRAPPPPSGAPPARRAGRGTRRGRRPSAGPGPWAPRSPCSSSSAVSSVHALPSRSRRCPLPRPTAVSNAIHASVTPSAVAGSSVVRKPCAPASVCSTRSCTPSGPSTVLMFQVNATRSRQKRHRRTAPPRPPRLRTRAPPRSCRATDRRTSLSSLPVLGEGLSGSRAGAGLREVVRLAGTPGRGSVDTDVGRHASGSPLCREIGDTQEFRSGRRSRPSCRPARRARRRRAARGRRCDRTR